MTIITLPPKLIKMINNSCIFTDEEKSKLIVLFDKGCDRKKLEKLLIHADALYYMIDRAVFETSFYEKLNFEFNIFLASYYERELDKFAEHDYDRIELYMTNKRK